MTCSDSIFSADEKANFLGKLTSDLPSTRFMSVKFFSISIANELLDLKRLADDDHVFFEDLCRTLQHITQDVNELSLIRNEAEIVLNQLKHVLNEPVLNVYSPVDEVDAAGEIEIKRACPACDKFCDESWVHCPYCGSKLDAAAGK
jgi:hypothetical protein